MSNKPRSQVIADNTKLTTEVAEKFEQWQTGLKAYQAKAAKDPDSDELQELNKNLTELSYELLSLLGEKSSVRSRLISEFLGKKPTNDAPVSLKVQTLIGLASIDKQETTPLLEGLQDLHIVVEPNTTIEEIKGFIDANADKIKDFLQTERVVPLNPLITARDKHIVELYNQGMSYTDIEAEIELDKRFTSTLDANGEITVDAIKQVLRRSKYKRDSKIKTLLSPDNRTDSL